MNNNKNKVVVLFSDLFDRFFHSVFLGFKHGNAFDLLGVASRMCLTLWSRHGMQLDKFSTSYYWHYYPGNTNPSKFNRDGKASTNKESTFSQRTIVDVLQASVSSSHSFY